MSPGPRPHWSVGRWILTFVTLVLLAAVVYLIFPTQWGGRAGIVRVSGSSMVPTFQQGDLLIMHKADYEVGDIVVYEVQDGGVTGRIVHRLIAENADGTFTAKGDNNAEPDPWPVRLQDIQGQVMWQVPAAAGLLALLQSPLVIALFGTVAVIALLWPRKKPEPDPPSSIDPGLSPPVGKGSSGVARLLESPPPAPETMHEENPHPSRDLALVIVAGVCGLVIATSLSLFVHVRGSAERDQALQLQVTEQAQRISTSFAALTAGLDTSAAWFNAIPNMTEAQFRTFATEMTHNNPDIASVWYAPRVPDRARARFEKSESPITQRVGDNYLSQTRQQEYLPMLFHQRGDPAHVGYDILSRPFAKEVVDWAMRHDATGVSGRITTVTGENVISAYEPVYWPGPHDTQKQRRTQFRGIVGASMAYEPALQSLLDPSKTHVDSAVIDDQLPGADPIVHSSLPEDATPRSAAEASDDWTLRATIELPNRDLTLLQRPLAPGFSWTTPEVITWVIGLAVALLLIALTLLYNRNSRRAELIDKLQGAYARLDYMAMHDPLTNLPNREHAWREMKSLIDAGAQFMVVFCHVQSLEVINLHAGRAAGDRYLREIGRVLGDVDGVEFARLGAAEFLGIFRGTDVAGVARIVLSRGDLLADIARTPDPFVIGVAQFPDDGTGPELLVSAAMADANLRPAGRQRT
ncbi:MAG: signal peptidase I [Candidatus Nanopelagicales bacterium]